MDWINFLRRAVGVLLVVPVLVLVFNPMVEIIRQASANKLFIMLSIAVYAALCIWGLLAWGKRQKK